MERRQKRPGARVEAPEVSLWGDEGGGEKDGVREEGTICLYACLTSSLTDKDE